MEDKFIILEKARALNSGKYWEKVIDLLSNKVLKHYNDEDLYIEKVKAFWELREIDECEKIITKVLLLNSSSFIAYLYYGHIYRQRKDYNLAEKHYKKSLDLNPTYSQAFNGLGNVAKIKGKNILAEEYFKKAILYNLNYAAPYYNLGRLYSSQQKYSLAEKELKKTIELKPDFSSAYISLGNVYVKKNNFSLAIEAYKKAVELNPNSSIAYLNFGLLYLQKKEYVLSEKLLMKSKEIDDRSSSVYNALGVLFYEQKEYKTADDYLKKALEIDPEYNSAYYNLGKLHSDLDNINEAKIFFETFLLYTKVDKKDYFYRSALSRIDELIKKIENSSYNKISKIINQIKELVLFNGECISHYTSISSVQFLLLNESPFRLSEGTFLNDTSEGEELFKFLGLSNSSTNTNYFEIFTKRPFIGSFVDADKNNDLTLWRMYGKEGLEEAKGCSITLNIKEFKAEIKNKINNNEDVKAFVNKDVEFYKVIYRKGENFCFSGSTTKSNELLAKLMINLKTEYSKFFKKKNRHKNEELEIIELLNEIAYLFKSIEYQYENEIRLVINESVGFDKKIDFKVDNFIPSLYPNRVYIELISIAPLLKTITIGPKVDKAEEWASTFHYFLANKGFKPEIHISKLPFK